MNVPRRQAEVREEVVPRGRTLWRRMRRNPYFWLGAGLLLLILTFCFVGPLFYAHQIDLVDVPHNLEPPSLQFPFGTDILGENQFVQMMVGGQVPIIAGFVTALIAASLGVGLGTLAAFGRSATDNAIMRIADVVFGIPQVVPILFIEAAFGATPTTLILTIGLTSWPATARLVRARGVRECQMSYVEAAYAVGGSKIGVIWRHFLPNIIDTVVASFVTQFSDGILLLAIATVIGLGLAPPWNWASMIGLHINYLYKGYWWLVVQPGVAISLLLLSAYFLGESVRQAFDPKRVQ